MRYEVLGDPNSIDAAWMTVALEDATVARGATVTELRFEGFIGTGQMARNARFSLVWDQPAGRPASVVGKFPSDDPTGRATGFDGGSYRKEWLFYRELRATVGVRTPEVWVAAFDEPASSFVLIMEDLNGSAQGDQFRGLTRDEAALAVEQAVLLHAPRWGDESLAVALGQDRDEGSERLSLIYGATMEGTIERLGPLLDGAAIDLVRAFAPLVQRWARREGTPATLAHMDFRPDNFLFGVEPGAPPLAVVDWQTISYAPGANDVAYMIGGGFEPDQRTEVERDLVADYAARLRAAGIDYGDDACWLDYRLGSLWGVAMSVIATMLAEQTERGDRMLSTMLRRHAAHALDLDALQLLA